MADVCLTLVVEMGLAYKIGFNPFPRILKVIEHLNTVLAF